MRPARPFSVFRSVPICVATGGEDRPGETHRRAADSSAAGAGRAFHGSRPRADERAPEQCRATFAPPRRAG